MLPQTPSTAGQDRFETFRALHTPGAPLLLFNAWDTGSAVTIAGLGARAIATSSWAVAAAHGYADGEALPFSLLLESARRMAAAVSVPVTVDIECGYADDHETLALNVGRLVDAGIAGINIEDRAPAGGLVSIDTQRRRIEIVREAAWKASAPIFINARTDLFLDEGQSSPLEARVNEAIEREAAYREAGASGLFVPGLADMASVARICAASRLPVNVMVMDLGADKRAWIEAGVARISTGPAPYLAAFNFLAETGARWLEAK